MKTACLLVALAADAAYASPKVGLMTDVGVPDGANLSLTVQPVRALRFEAGVGHDAVGPGVRAGMTWIVLGSWATPVLGVSYGRFFERDANPLARKLSGDATLSSPLLDKVGYDFASARSGFELGHKRFTFFLHAGVTRISGVVHGLGDVGPTDGMVTITTSDPHVVVWTASADLGCVLYFN